MVQLKKSNFVLTRLAPIFGMLALLAATGCATSMSYSTYPQPLEPGEVSGSVAGQLTLNSAIIDTTLNSLEIATDYAVDHNEELTEAEYRDLLDTLVTYALFRPAVNPEVAMRVGVWDGIDVGLRYNMSMYKGDAKVRVWESDDKESVVSVSAGLGRAGGLGPSSLKYITWSEFSRLDLDVAVMYGHQPSEYFRVYGGPRMLHSWLTVEPVISPELEALIPEEYQQYRPDQYFQDENILYLGGTAGLMVGYDWIWVHLEATVMYTFFNPMIIDTRRDLSGVTVAPVAGISVEF